MKLSLKIITAIATAFVVASLVTPPLFAEDGNGRGPMVFGHHGGGFDGHHGPGHPGMHIQRLLKRLDLTVEQRDQVESIFMQNKPQMREIAETMRTNRDRLSLVSPDDADYSNVVAEVSQSNGALAEQTTLLAARVQSEVWAVLTDEQKTKAAELRQEMRDRWQRKIDAMQERLDATR